MKKILLSLVATIALFNLNAQNSYTLLGTDFYFDPDTLYVAPGDTVNFINNGYHSATEIDSVDWVNDVDNHNGGFDVGFGAATSDMWFVINSVGTYYYICGPHASMGMKGVVIVQQGVGLDEKYSEENYSVYSQNNNLMLSYVDADLVEIYDLNGKLVLSKRLEAQSTASQFGHNLTTGNYIFRFTEKGQLRANKKQFVQ